MAEWTDNEKAEVIAAYEAANPTPETSTEIIAELAEQFEKTANGVRMILVKAEVYVKKSPASAGKKGNGTSTRVNKAEAIDGLASIINSQGMEADDEIIGKLTGKAAVYFTGVIEKLTEAQ